MPDVCSCCLFTMKKLGCNFIWFPCCLSLHFSAICLLSSLCSSEEIEKKLTAYRKGCKIWNMLIFCQVWKNMCVIICITRFFTSLHVEYLCTCYFTLCKLALCILQGGPGHLYLLKNKVATFAKVEKEEDMIQWVFTFTKQSSACHICFFLFYL